MIHSNKIKYSRCNTIDQFYYHDIPSELDSKLLENLFLRLKYLKTIMKILFKSIFAEKTEKDEFCN